MAHCTAFALAGSLASCAGKPPLAGPATAPPRAVERSPSADVLSPATSEEREIAGRLRDIVGHLAGRVGERHSQKSWNLAEAADDLARRLEQLGYSVRRQGFVAGDEVVQNLEVTVPGKERGDESVVIGAHYDTAPGTPGADDDASGVSVVVELARRLRASTPARSLRFVLFANGAAPHFRTSTMGSLVYAKELIGHGARISAMLNLHAVGYYSSAARSQRPPPAGTASYPSAGSFIGVLGTSRSGKLVEQVQRALAKSLPMPVVADSAAEILSDDWAFIEAGVPTVSVTDTGPLRNPHHGLASDLPDQLDYDRMSRLVIALSGTIADLATPESPRDPRSLDLSPGSPAPAR